MEKPEEQFLTVADFAAALRNHGIKTTTEIVESMAKKDELDFKTTSEGAYLIPKSEVERIEAATFYTTNI